MLAGHHESARPPAAAAHPDRPLRLSARLPSTCALEVEILDDRTIGRVRGAPDNAYTAGVICAKVARYAERIHHPDRLTQPLRRTGPKGSGSFEPISWDDALDLVGREVPARPKRATARSRSGRTTMPAPWAWCMRDGIHRLRHAKKYSGFHSTICVNASYTGFAAGTGRIAGPDPREMAKSDLIVIWGTNPVNTQVNVMTHATRARKERGAKIVAVDVYMNGTMEQADLAVLVKPGTDGALACAVMHCLFRDGKADWDYLDKYTDAPRELEAHRAHARPGMGVGDHRLPGRDHRGVRPRWSARPSAPFSGWATASRARATAPVNMHAASCIAGGHRRLAARGRRRVPQQRRHLPLEQVDDRRPRRARPVDPHARPVAHRRDPLRRPRGAEGRAAGHGDADPEHQSGVGRARIRTTVKRGFAREDLFVCVHEQFMTETAKMADVVLPATMFMEHDDFYQGGGHQYILLGPKLIEPPGECRSNHEVICGAGRARSAPSIRALP